MYIICELNHKPNWVSFIVSGDGLSIASFPKPHITQNKIPNVIAPRLFVSNADASEYLDANNDILLNDWERNKDYYTAVGLSMPQWKIYPHDEVSQVLDEWG